LDGKTRFLRPAEKLDIKDPRKSSPRLFGFYVDFLEDTLSPVDEDHCLERIVDPFDDDLPTFKSGQNDLEPVFVKFLLANNSISIPSLNRGKFLLSAFFQNPISGNRVRSRKIVLFRETGMILDVVLVFASFYHEKRIGFVPRNSKS